MELLAALVFAVVALVVSGLLVRSAQAQSQKGWLVASEADHRVRMLLIARVTTLENRLDSRTWQEFATLQSIPDETAKVGWAEKSHAESTDPSFLALRKQWRDEGQDMEGEDSFEGGSVIG